MFKTLIARAAQAKSPVIISLVTDGAEDPPSPKGNLEALAKTLGQNPRVIGVLVAGLMTKEGQPFRTRFETRVAALGQKLSTVGSQPQELTAPLERLIQSVKR